MPTPDEVHADGCSYVPDFGWRSVCDLHDVAYRTHQRLDGSGPISKWAADWHALQGWWRDARTPGEHLLAPVYWLGVTLFGWPAWWKGRQWKKPR